MKSIASHECSQTDWDAQDHMKDAEIDLSEDPEMSTEQLERPFKDSSLESGFGLLRAKPPAPGATRDLNAIDVAQAMREQGADEWS